MNIFNLREEHIEILSILEEMDGEITPELQERWDQLIQNSEDKIKQFYWVYKQIEANLSIVVSEKARIEVIKKRTENQMDRIKTTMDALMKGLELDAIKDGTIDVILAKKTDFVYDEGKVPDGYYETVETKKFKLQDFKTWCKNNQEAAKEICNAEFIENKAIRIR